MAATSNVIGLILPGQPVQVNGQIMSDNEIMFQLPVPHSQLQHLVLFLTGAQALPENHGASVYLMLSDNGFKFLGHLANDKPSAIFRVSSSASTSKSSASNSPPAQPAMLSAETAIVAVTPEPQFTRIGVLVEPLSAIQQKIVPKEQQVQQQQTDYLTFVKALAQNCYDHMSGWILTEEQWRTRGQALVQEKLVPIGALEQWFDSFRRKLTQNPNFWKKSIDS
ncbi:unnamed protein product [Amoebophrya sp. A120]|nr:unnamed protein product [Amoebophrya sp. A120]|eukprot:GSA120T00011270001.1